MKLYTSKASPFGRTVEMVAREVGLYEGLEIVPTTVAPGKANPSYQSITPFKKIPTLVADDGLVLVDSAVIAEFLAERAGDTVLFARGRDDRFTVIGAYAMARGIAECAVATRYETAARPEDKRWPDGIDDQLGRITAALDRFEADPPVATDAPTIADLALVASLGYLDFRFPELGWRNERPRVSAWYSSMEVRPSVVMTRPD